MKPAAAAFKTHARKHLRFAFVTLLLLGLLSVPASAGSLTVTTISPGNGQTISGSVNWSVSVQPQNVDHVDFAIDGTVRYTATHSPWTFGGNGLDSTTLSNGSHELKATAYTQNGNSSASSAVVVTVANGSTGPSISSAPTISGTPTVGQVLTASTGSWNGTTPMTFTYGWSKCDSAGANCASIAGANAATYTLASGDAGSTVRVSVTATNTAASAIANSSPTAVVASGSSSPPSGGGTAPKNTSLPTISGTATVGQALSASVGSWSGSTPMTYGYAWARCSSAGSSCTAISGATGATYTLASVDAGATLRVTVNATNSVASASATSNQTAVVGAGSSTTKTTTTGTTTTTTTTTPTTTTTTQHVSSSLGTSLPGRMPESSGTTYYVSNNGSDSNPGTLAAPWQTLQKAFATVSSGAVIDLRGGTYSGEIVLQDRSFSESNPVTIQSYPGETAVFTGSSKECYPAIYVGDAAGIRFRNLRVTNSMGNGYKIDNSAHVEIDHNWVGNNGCQGIYVGGYSGSGVPRTYSQDIQIWNSVFTHNGGYFTGNEGYAVKGDHSMYLGGGALDGAQHGLVGGVVANNVIYDQHTGYGIELGQSAWNVIITNNTIDHAYQNCCSDVAGDGIVIFNDGSSAWPSQGITVVNNLLTNNYSKGVYGVCGSSMTSNTVRNNLAYGNGMGDYDASYGSTCTLFSLGTNRPSANPLYVDAGAHDYHLQSGSPALGAADPAFAPQTDADGNARPAAPAIGAYG